MGGRERKKTCKETGMLKKQKTFDRGGDLMTRFPSTAPLAFSLRVGARLSSGAFSTSPITFCKSLRVNVLSTDRSALLARISTGAAELEWCRLHRRRCQTPARNTHRDRRPFATSHPPSASLLARMRRLPPLPRRCAPGFGLHEQSPGAKGPTPDTLPLHRL